MPLPKHVFDPPFNVVRTSHVVLGVTDLDRSLAFYQATLGLHLEDRTPSEAYLRGVEERQHHSLVLKKTTTPACERIGFKVGSDEDLDKAAAFPGGERPAPRLCRRAVSGPNPAGDRPVRHAARVLLQDGATPAPAPALRPLQGRAGATARPLQHVLARAAGRRSTSTRCSASA